MKIAITSRAPFIAGAEIAGERLAQGLKDLGHEVLMIVGSRGAALDRFSHNGIRCVYNPLPLTGSAFGIKYRSSRKKLQNLLSIERPDIVHSNDLPSHQITSDAAMRLKIPRVCHHRWIYDSRQAIDWFNKFGADRHIYVSESTKHELERCSESLSNQSSVVIHDGIPITDAPTEQDKLNQKIALGLNKDQLHIGFVGQICKHKGVEDLIVAWSLLKKRRSDFDKMCNLTIVGDDLKNEGEYLQEMKTLALRDKLHINFTGYQTNTAAWFRAFDITIVPSHREPFGLVTVEAMAECSAVIGSRTGGIAEIVSHDENGILVRPENPSLIADSIERLIDNRALLRQFAFAGRKTCEQKFSAKTNAEKIGNVFEDLLEARIPCRSRGSRKDAI